MISFKMNVLVDPRDGVSATNAKQDLVFPCVITHSTIFLPDLTHQLASILHVP
jgi:hypothetical protein